MKDKKLVAILKDYLVTETNVENFLKRLDYNGYEITSGEKAQKMIEMAYENGFNAGQGLK